MSNLKKEINKYNKMINEDKYYILPIHNLFKNSIHFYDLNQLYDFCCQYYYYPSKIYKLFSMKKLKLTSSEYTSILLPLQVHIHKVYDQLKKLFKNHYITASDCYNITFLFDLNKDEETHKNAHFTSLLYE